MKSSPEVSELTLSEIGQQERVKFLQEKEYIHQQLVQGLAAALYTCDADGYIKFYNKSAVELWGREPEIGKDLWCGSWKIFRPDGTPLSFDECPMAKVLKTGKPVRNEEIIVERPDGVRRNIMPYPGPIFDSSGKLVEAVNMLVDITDLKQKETALRNSEEKYKQIAEDLEGRVVERTKELQQANTALKHTNEELEEFAFIASHDMQEPLRKIKTFVLRLQERTPELINEKAEFYLSKITNASERMSNLINDILHYSRLSQIDSAFEPTDLNEVLKNVLTDFEVSIEEKGAIIQNEELPIVQAIPLQMNQLFHNLLTNSLKFCRNEIPCEISISSKQLLTEEVLQYGLNEDLSYCEISFKDNGIGFEQKFSENIFRIFERLNTRDKYKGTGIGLALCRKIINKHHGKIFASSTLNEGTVMHVILPILQIQ